MNKTPSKTPSTHGRRVNLIISLILAIRSNPQILFHERLIKDRKKLGPKADKIAELFRLFNVGVLVVDEIQKFSDFSNKVDL